MHSSTWTSLLLLGLAQLVPETVAAPSTSSPNIKPGRAIYMNSNEERNSVIALPIGSNGLVSQGTSTSTGGAGSKVFVVSGNTTQPAGTDALASQSAVSIAGNYLFAVNAGSNTITMFAIDPADPIRLTMVGRPVSVPGDFPNTITASAKNQLVCVGTTGAKSGVSCAPFTSWGVQKMDQLRPINLKQTTPPVGPLDTVSQVFFSEDGDTLFVAVKGDPATNSSGILGIFGVDRPRDGHGPASVCGKGKLTSVEGTLAPFGSTTIQGSSDIFVADAGFGAVILSVDAETGSASIKSKAVIEGQIATCWVVISPVTNTAFVTDVALDRVVEISPIDASIMSITDLSTNGDLGLTDLRAAGNFIYALSPGNGTGVPAVTVMDVRSKKQVQHFQLKGLNASNNAQGMAVLL
ncbi:hypothetical protein V8C37DRAFT_399114 [Trichoderma ceciliae]